MWENMKGEVKATREMHETYARGDSTILFLELKPIYFFSGFFSDIDTSASAFYARDNGATHTHKIPLYIRVM